MSSLGDISLHPSERFSGRDAIQTPYAEYNVGADLPKASEKELAKLAKRAEKEERSARAALLAGQVGHFGLLQRSRLLTFIAMLLKQSSLVLIFGISDYL